MAHYKINELKGPFGYSREGDGTVVYMFVQDLDLNAVQQVVEYAYDNYTEDEEGEEVRDWAEYSPAMLDTETAGRIKDKLNCVEVTKNITTDGSVIENNYGSGVACGGSVHSLNGDVYRSYNGGIAKLDENLDILVDTRIGDYGFENVYSVEVLGEYIYFGLSDYFAPDEVVVLNSDGDEIETYEVGAIPGDFVAWDGCFANGDINVDNMLNITDVVMVVYYVLDNADYLCEADVNNDGSMDILDIISMVQEILNN